MAKKLSNCLLCSLSEIINNLRQNQYDEGIKGYINDAQIPEYNETTGLPILRAAIIDFLECRLIEQEEEE